MATEKTITEAIVEEMKSQAPLDWTKAGLIAEKFKVKTRAVVASATRQGIEYKRKKRATKSGAPIVSKAELVHQISDRFDVSVESLDGLEKATKTALQVLADC